MPPLITPAGEAKHSVNSAARVWRKRKREAERVRARARPRRFLPSFPPPTLRPLRRRFSAISGYHIPRVPSLASAVPRHSLSRRPLYHVFAVFPFLVMHLRSMSRASCRPLLLSLYLSLSLDQRTPFLATGDSSASSSFHFCGFVLHRLSRSLFASLSLFPLSPLRVISSSCVCVCVCV